MTHLSRVGLAPATAPPRHDIPKPQLDRGGLRAGIDQRRLILADLEAALATACETAAARGGARTVRIAQRETWDQATWQRYLDAASRLEPEYGPRMRRLFTEIDQLERLIALPSAA
jgi:hypothetical protein